MLVLGVQHIWILHQIFHQIILFFPPDVAEYSVIYEYVCHQIVSVVKLVLQNNHIIFTDIVPYTGWSTKYLWILHQIFKNIQHLLLIFIQILLDVPFMYFWMLHQVSLCVPSALLDSPDRICSSVNQYWIFYYALLCHQIQLKQSPHIIGYY